MYVASLALRTEGGASPFGDVSVVDATTRRDPLNFVDPAVSFFTADTPSAFGVTVSAPASKGAVPFAASGISLALRCSAPARVALVVSSWEVTSGVFSPQWRYPTGGGSVSVEINAQVGYRTYDVQLADERVLLAASPHTAVAIAGLHGSPCSVPVVLSNSSEFPVTWAPEFGVSPAAWALCTAGSTVCELGTARELRGLPVLAIYADIEPCPTVGGWRGWPRWANAAGASTATLARYLPGRCRMRGLDIIVIVLFSINFALLVCWFFGLLLGTCLMCAEREDKDEARLHRGITTLLLGVFLCVLDQVTDALWFLLTDWDKGRASLGYASFALIILNQIVFFGWGLVKLVNFYAPLVVMWLRSIVQPCGIPLGVLGRAAERALERRLPREHLGVYRLLFKSHMNLHELIFEILWIAFVVAITPLLLVVQSTLYTTQLMSLWFVADGWSRIMGLPISESDGKKAEHAEMFDVWSWNVARLAEIMFESLPGFLLQAYALNLDSRAGVRPSGIAIASFTLSTYMLAAHLYHYWTVYVYTSTAPWLMDPTVDYYQRYRDKYGSRRNVTAGKTAGAASGDSFDGYNPAFNTTPR